MIFNSVEFGLFFVVVAAMYFVLPHRCRRYFLLLASYYFYMSWKPAYALLIFMSTVVDYVAGLQMGKCLGRKERRKWLIGSLAVNLGLLFFFKYHNFFAQSLNELAVFIDTSPAIPLSDFLLPVGISFYTFQTLSYSIEVYRGKQEPERSFSRFALYVSFFPQLVAGPIERAGNLLPQLQREYDFDYDRVTSGLKLMAWGFFKKMVIADNLAVMVDLTYTDSHAATGPMYVIATVLFGFQIFCDFSGYSDIAIGTARVLGIKLMENFRRPYHAASIREFWKRWHISLTTWFRDYLYIPLGGNRVRVSRWYVNLVIVFLVSGLWHGAKWTFVYWGLMHGLFFVISHLTGPLRAAGAKALRLDRIPRLHQAGRIGFTFCLVTFTWIFFRAESLAQAFHVVSRLPTGWECLWDSQAFARLIGALQLTKIEHLVALFSIGIMEAVHLLQTRVQVGDFLARRSVWVRWSVYSGLLWWIFLFGSFGQKQFIYFVF